MFEEKSANEVLGRFQVAEEAGLTKEEAEKRKKNTGRIA